MDNKDFYKQLIHRYATNQATEEELEVFFALLESPDMDDELHAYLLEEANHEDHKYSKIKHHRRWLGIVAAASVIIILGISSYFYIQYKRPQQVAVAQKPAKSDIAPGKNAATLTLANGKKIILSSQTKGKLAEEAGVTITKSANGQIVYTIKETNTEVANQYNILSTAKGETYMVNLPDGTEIWLNAASTLKYPVKFNRDERLVELNGEAYFQVAKDPEKPFRVSVNGSQDVKVLGTHFDVKAYEDDQDIKTTLLEGSVKLTYKNKQLILKPGQMAINDFTGSLITQQADIEEVMGWKNGLFVFNDETLKDVMKIAARWYNIDVEYKGNVERKRLRGIVSKYKNITELLDNIAITSGIHYQIEGRRVILTN